MNFVRFYTTVRLEEKISQSFLAIVVHFGVRPRVARKLLIGIRRNLVGVFLDWLASPSRNLLGFQAMARMKFDEVRYC